MQSNVHRPTSRPLVLVVDEEAADRDLAAVFLRRAGFRVAPASCWDAALGTARELPVAAAVAHVEALTLDATKLLRELKAIRPGLRFVAKPCPLTKATLVDRVRDALGG